MAKRQQDFPYITKIDTHESQCSEMILWLGKTHFELVPKTDWKSREFLLSTIVKLK